MSERLGNYILLNAIAKGGMATVHRAVHEPTGREVALKILAPSLAADTEYIGRFLREAKTLMELRHPNIVQVFEANAAQGQYFIAMELLGETLSESLGKLRAARQLIPQAKALIIARQIAAALQFAHEKGLVHRDVKPSNVLIARDPGGRTRYVLSDFGVVKDTEATRLTHTEMTIGTPAYMSPEQLLTPGKIDRRSDLYSLGMVLYEMLSGATVYEGMTPVALMYNIAHEPLPTITRYRADLTRATRDILDKLLSKKTETRFQTAKEVMDAIDRALEQKEERSKLLPILLVAGATLICSAGFLAMMLSAQGSGDANGDPGPGTPTRTATPTPTPTGRAGGAAPGSPGAGTATLAVVATSTLIPDPNGTLPPPAGGPGQATPTPSPVSPGATSTLISGPTNPPPAPGATQTPTATPTATVTGTPPATPTSAPPPTSPPAATATPAPTSPPATATSPAPTSPPPTSTPAKVPTATPPPFTVSPPTSTPPKISTAPAPTATPAPVPVGTAPPPAG